jgi:hypothetical protein
MSTPAITEFTSPIQPVRLTVSVFFGNSSSPHIRQFDARENFVSKTRGETV